VSDLSRAYCEKWISRLSQFSRIQNVLDFATWPRLAIRDRSSHLFTMGHIRSHGCRSLLVYCGSPWCNHSASVNADSLADDVVVRALCPRMICTACGLIGADVRPDWRPHVNQRHV